MNRNLENLANRKFDVLVIGGGIHGAVTAWDAALRGLSVALIERRDFGSETSQNSLKIIHGGLRYLQDGNLSRIRTMARERTTWMKIAPHLVHPLTCLTPTRPKISRSRLVLGAGLIANDLLSFDRNQLADPQKKLPRGKIISQHELSHLLPGYDVGTTTGAAVWHDAQIYNSERLLLEFILSAASIGAEVANYVEAIGFLQHGHRIHGVQARDVQTGQIFDIQAKVVINCTGAWIESLLEKATVPSEYSTSIAMNVFVDKVWSGVAAGLPSQPVNGKPSQILFIVPWRNKSMIGTWHMPWHDAPDSFRMNETVLLEFIDEINSAHPPLKLSLRDIQHVTWGFLPVSKNDAGKKPVRLTRDGVVIDHHRKNGIAYLISVLGVKYTTARSVAEQAVDLAANKLDLKTTKCQTHRKPVLGGRIAHFNMFMKQAIAEAPRVLHEEIIEHLAYTYGSEYPSLLQYIKNQSDLAQRMDPRLPVTAAEVIHAVHHEMALTLADVIQRRTELGATGLPSINAIQKCVDVMGSELGWSTERQQQEIESVIEAYPIKPMERVVA